jgi:hypothetical protein
LLTSATHVSMLLNASIRDYINQDFQNGLERLLWLKALAVSVLELPEDTRPTSPDLDRFKSYNDKIDVLIRQLSLRFDYYGQPLNEVPLLSFNYYVNLISDLMNYGKDIENAYLTYSNISAKQEEAKAAFLQAQAKARLSIQTLEADNAQLLSKQEPLNDAIERLSNSLNDLWVQLMQAQARFQEAVAAKGRGCSFQQIVALGAVIATLITTGGAAAPAIGLAIQAVAKQPLKYDNGSPVEDNFQGFKYKVNTLVTVGRDAGTFIDAFNQVREKIAPKPVPGSDVPGLPSDETKIVATADEVEQQLKPFMDMPEAQSYNTLLRAFVSTSEARNNKIIEYNNLILNWQRNNTDIAQVQLDADAAQNAFSASQNPFVAEAAIFMAKAWVDSKVKIVRVLSEINRAYQYYLLFLE